MILSIKKAVLIILFLILWNKIFFATVVVNAPSCNQNIQHTCDETGNCTTNTICAFPPINITKSADARDVSSHPMNFGNFSKTDPQAIIAEAPLKMPPLVFLTLKPTVIIKNIGNILEEQELTLKILPRTQEQVITYTPNIGKYAHQSISFLFYMINLKDADEINAAPPYMKNQIQAYTKGHPTAQYVFFIAKNNRNLEQWRIITQTYIADFDMHEAIIQISIHPDGNISLLIPTIFNEAENKVTKPQLFSIDIGQI